MMMEWLDPNWKCRIQRMMVMTMMMNTTILLLVVFDHVNVDGSDWTCDFGRFSSVLSKIHVMDQKLPLRYFYYYYCYQYSSQSVDTVRWWYFDRFVVNIVVAVIVATLSVVDDDDSDNIASFFFVSQGLAFNTTVQYIYIYCDNYSAVPLVLTSSSDGRKENWSLYVALACQATYGWADRNKNEDDVFRIHEQRFSQRISLMYMCDVCMYHPDNNEMVLLVITSIESKNLWTCFSKSSDDERVPVIQWGFIARAHWTNGKKWRTIAE